MKTPGMEKMLALNTRGLHPHLRVVNIVTGERGRIVGDRSTHSKDIPLDLDSGGRIMADPRQWRLETFREYLAATKPLVVFMAAIFAISAGYAFISWGLMALLWMVGCAVVSGAVWLAFQYGSFKGPKA